MPETPAEFVPGAETARAFRTALGQYATGVTIITTMTPDGPLGMTANSFASVSLEPALVLWSPAKSSRRFQPFAEASRYAIHVLGSEQHDLCAHFAKQGSDFEALDWAEGPDGVPLIDGCLARFDCALHSQADGGDHLIIVGEVLRASMREGEALLFAHGSFGRFTSEG